MSCNSNNSNNFVTLANTRLRFPEEEADALKHVAVLTVYKILFTHMYCAFVGLGNKMYMFIAYLYVDNLIDYYFTVALKWVIT